MGWIKDAKLEIVAKGARTSYDDGKSVWACRLNVGATDPGMSGEIPVWSDMIATVEEIGWKLDRWSVASDNKGRPEAYLLFRR